MATVLNRTTKQLLTSANTPDHPSNDWIINPDLSSVSGVPPKYWVITGDVVSVMDAATQAIVDATDLQKVKDATELESQRGVLKAVIAALVKTINLRLPVDQKISKAEIVAAIKGEL